METRDIYPIRVPDAMRLKFPDGTVVEYPKQTIQALTEIAVRNSLGYGAALVQSIANEKFLLDQEQSGAKLIVELSDGTLRRLERSPIE
ncbi:hypothetical protein KW801_03625 [Candidatus Saccharibacteria bacterium]|nr:hypothetical protein [Candidatus Saccharibacteria bacterium]